MKKLFSLIALVGCFTVAVAQTPSTVTTPSTTITTDQTAPAPTSLEWKDGTSHSFGTVMQDNPASFSFEFTNIGKEPIVITKAQPSCSCTVSDYTKDPVLPGKTGYVKATYNAHNPGQFNKSITVTTDKGETVMLLMNGTVEQKPADQTTPTQDQAPQQK